MPPDRLLNVAYTVLLQVTDPKKHDDLIRELESEPEPPPGAPAPATPRRGRRPKGWGANDDLAEAESLRALQGIRRATR